MATPATRSPFCEVFIFLVKTGFFCMKFIMATHIIIFSVIIRTVMFPLDMAPFSSAKEKAEMAADFVSKADLISNTGYLGTQIQYTYTQIQMWVTCRW